MKLLTEFVVPNIRILRNYSFLKPHNVGIIGVPFDKGQHRAGTGEGPEAIRNGGLVKQLQLISAKINVKDYGDVKYEEEPNGGRNVTNMKLLSHVASCNRNLSDKVEEILKDDRVCLTLGGDHSIAIGSIDGHLRHNRNISVIWVDAHADFNTNASSPSGNIHGMPVALLAKEMEDYWPYIPGMDWQKPHISLQNFVMIGLRSVDDYEKFMIEKFGVKVFGMREIELFGIKEVMRMAKLAIDPYDNRSLHVSFDIDSLDPCLEAPSTGTPVRGGLTLREGVYIMEECFATGRLEAVDLVEVNPKIGSESDVKKTVEAAIEILKASVGNNRSGNFSSENIK